MFSPLSWNSVAFQGLNKDLIELDSTGAFWCELGKTVYTGLDCWWKGQ